MNLEPGERYGDGDRYRCLRELGRGGVAVVYLLEDERLERKVCGKFAGETSKCSRNELQKIFLHEAQVLTRLDGDPAPVFYDKHESVPAILMEYVPGTSLDEYFEKCTKTEKWLGGLTLLGMMNKLVAAVQKCHVKHVVHGDLKPANVILRPATEENEYEVCLLDFGAARFIDETQGSTAIKPFFTPGYGAPELYGGEVPPEPSADIYSLGAILFSFLAHRCLEYGDTLQDFGSQTTRIDPRLRETCVRMTCEDPDDRVDLDEAAAQFHELYELLSSEADQQAKCPHCLSLVAAGKFCPHCGKSMVRQVTGTLRPASQDGSAFDNLVQAFNKEKWLDVLAWARKCKIATDGQEVAAYAIVSLGELSIEGLEDIFRSDCRSWVTKAAKIKPEKLPASVRLRFLRAWGEVLNHAGAPLRQFEGWFHQGVKEWPKDEILWLHLVSSSESDDKDRILDEGLSQCPKSGKLWRAKGRELYTRGNERGCFDCFNLAIANGGDNDFILVLGAWSLAKCFDPKKEILWQQRLFEWSTDDPEERLQLAEFAEERGKADVALDHVEAGLLLQSTHTGLNHRKAKLLFKQQKYKLLIEFLPDRTDVVDRELQLLRGRALFELDNYDAALNHLLPLMDRLEIVDGVEPWIAVIRCFIGTNRESEARDSLKKAMEHFPGDKKLGRLSEQLGSSGDSNG